MNKFFDFAVLCVYVLGVVGGSCNLFYNHLPLFGVTTLLLGAMAFPYVRDRFKDLMA